MAIINVDAHILKELIGYSNKQKNYFEEFTQSWTSLLEALDYADTIYWKSEGKKEMREHSEKEMRRHADRIWRCRKKLAKIILKISVCEAKRDALILHLVGEIREVDTGKGLEGKKS